MKYRILWCQDYYEGPVNGLATTEAGNKVWFQRDEDKILEQTPFEKGENEEEEEDDEEEFEFVLADEPNHYIPNEYFSIYRLQAYQVELAEENHRNWCVTFSRPYLYGDTTPMKGDKRKKLIPVSLDEAEKMKSHPNTNKFEHQFVPLFREEDLIERTHKSNFLNYSIPRIVE